MKTLYTPHRPAAGAAGRACMPPTSRSSFGPLSRLPIPIPILVEKPPFSGNEYTLANLRRSHRPKHRSPTRRPRQNMPRTRRGRGERQTPAYPCLPALDPADRNRPRERCRPRCPRCRHLVPSNCHPHRICPYPFALKSTRLMDPMQPKSSWLENPRTGRDLRTQSPSRKD